MGQPRGEGINILHSRAVEAEAYDFKIRLRRREAEALNLEIGLRKWRRSILESAFRGGGVLF